MKKILTIIITLSLLLSSSVVSLYAVTITNNSSSNTSSSSPLTGTNGNISADDNAELVPEISYEYVDFGASVDKNAEYADDSIIVTMKRGVKEANHVYTAKDFPELDVDYIEDLTYLTNVYRVHVGDMNGWGTDIITEVASSATAYRSTVHINLGTSNGFENSTYTYNLRTYFYIDYVT